MKKIGMLNYKGHEYMVVDTEVVNEFGYRYGTVDTQYITNSKLNRQLNGFQMCISKTKDEAIESRKRSIDFKEMKDAGMTDMEIFQKMMEDEK